MNVKTKTYSWGARTLRILPAVLMIVFAATRANFGAWNGKGDRAVSSSASARLSEPRYQPQSESRSEPWTSAETVSPALLVNEMADAKGADHPVIVCAGFRILYDGGHVPGSVFHGMASKPEGLDDLKKWAQGIPRSSRIVVYCGCCPFAHCPNIRPAFEMLRSMGFRHLRVLLLPNSFAKDWAGQGYPVEKGR